MATVGTVISNNAEMLDLPSGQVLINPQGDLIRVVKKSLSEKDHLIVITRSGHFNRTYLELLDPEVSYNDAPFTVLA